MVDKTNNEQDKINHKPKLQNFREKTEYLRNGGGEGGLGHRGTLEWHLSQDVGEYYDDTRQDVTVENLTDFLKESRTGLSFLEDEEQKDLKIDFDTQISISQFYPDQNLITLNPNHPKMVLVVNLIRELRRSWQHVRGQLINPLEYQPDEAILLNRAQQADATMMYVRIAWEMKLNNDNMLWDHLLATSNADIARGFEMRARSDFRSLNNGDAARTAYDMWFAEERMRFHDKRIIHQMLLDDSAEEQPMHVLDGQLIYSVADMPHGKNYLSLPGYKAPTDRDYVAVEDRSNANFLWFIKFERSFQAREREMIENTAASPTNIVDIQSWKKEYAEQ